MARIIKAGDGGSGARARDGVGGNDSSNGAPYNGTSGDDTGGGVGAKGEIYLFDNSSTSPNVESSFKEPSYIDATPGSRGNDGWGGVNLYVYSANRDVANKGISGGYEAETFGTFNVYNNGKCVDAENPNQVTNYYTVYSKFEIGRKVSDERADKLNVITKNNDGGSTWYEIYFSKNNDHRKVYYENSTSIINDENKFYARLFTSGSINAYPVIVGTMYQIDELNVKIFVLPYPSNATSFCNALCYGLSEGAFKKIT